MVNIFTFFKSAPKFKIWHSHPNQTSQVLVTAGMHGDELSSIEAAKLLIKTYHGNVPITIIPILNLAGYKKGLNYNPLDNKDPIYVYPGSNLGSSTSRLIHELSTELDGKRLWIDLHGGGRDEHLKPFVWAAGSYPFLESLNAPILVDQTFKRNLPYAILESGELGTINNASVDQHIEWVNTILKNLNHSKNPAWQPTYNHVVYETRKNQPLQAENLLWYSRDLYVSGKIT